MPRAFAAFRRSIGFAPTAAAVAFALAPARARAEDTRAEAEPVEILVTAPPGSSRAPAAQATVVQADKFAGEDRSVAELLSTSPGVSVHALGGPGQATTLSLRGASADQSLVLLDGIPLHGPGGGAVDLATLPAALLDRLVISRGVLGAQFGAGALGGVVELVPRRARSAGLAADARLSAGSFGTFGASSSVSVPWKGEGGGLVALSVDRTAGDFLYDQQLTPEVASSPYYEFTRANADSWRGSALLRGGWPLAGEDAGIDVLFQGSLGDRGLPGSAASPTPRSRELDRSALLGARFRGSAGAATYSVRAWGDLDRIELRGVSAFGDCADGSPDCPRSLQSASAARGEVELAAPWGDRQWVRGSVTAGMDRASGDATGFHRRGVFSASISDDVRLGAVSVFPAVRVDVVGKDAGVSPAVAAMIRPWSAPIELRAGAGLSFRVPSFSELYLQQGGLAPNTDLAPEHGRSVDVGVAYRAGKLTLSAGAFASWYRDLIVYELFPPAAVKPFNVGAARILGLELQAVATLPYGLTAELAYTALQATNTRPGTLEGHSLPYRPPHRLFLRLAHHADRFESYAETNATASMPRNQFDTAFVPAQVLVNAGAGARVAGTLWIDVEAKNLLDDRTMQDLFQYPLPGLSLAVIARARL